MLLHQIQTYAHTWHGQTRGHAELARLYTSWHLMSHSRNSFWMFRPRTPGYMTAGGFGRAYFALSAEFKSPSGNCSLSLLLLIGKFQSKKSIPLIRRFQFEPSVSLSFLVLGIYDCVKFGRYGGSNERRATKSTNEHLRASGNRLCRPYSSSCCTGGGTFVFGSRSGSTYISRHMPSKE